LIAGLGIQLGQWSRALLGTKLGTDSAIMIAMPVRIVVIFQRGKSSISRSRASRRRRLHAGSVALIARTLMFGPSSSLDLVLVDLGDLADQPAAGDDLVALLHGVDRVLKVLHPLLLRTDHQEIKGDEDEDERQERLDGAMGLACAAPAACAYAGVMNMGSRKLAG
jgi:hypothetical protein